MSPHLPTADDPFAEPTLDPLDPGDAPMLLVGAVVRDQLAGARLSEVFATLPQARAVLGAVRHLASRGEPLHVATIAEQLANRGAFAGLWSGQGDFIEWWNFMDPVSRSLGLDVEATLGHVWNLALLRAVRACALAAGAAVERSDVETANRKLARALELLVRLRWHAQREEVAA